MKNKQKHLLSVILAVIAALSAGFAWLVYDQSDARFSLEPELYQGSEIKEINAADYQKLIEQRKSFVVIAHMDFCPAETPLTTTAEALAHEDGLTFYGLNSDEFAKTALAAEIRYLPSAAIIRQGELVRYLDAESDDDIPYYQTASAFRDWLSKDIQL